LSDDGLASGLSCEHRPAGSNRLQQDGPNRPARLHNGDARRQPGPCARPRSQRRQSKQVDNRQAASFELRKPLFAWNPEMEKLRPAIAAGIIAFGLSLLASNGQKFTIPAGIAGLTSSLVYAGMSGWLNWIRRRLVGVLCSGGCLGA